MENFDLSLSSDQLLVLLNTMYSNQLSDLGVELHPSQLQKLIKVLTPEQLEKVLPVYNLKKLLGTKKMLTYKQSRQVFMELTKPNTKPVSTQQLFNPKQLWHLEEELDKAYTKLERSGPIWMKITSFILSFAALFWHNIKHRFDLTFLLTLSLLCYFVSFSDPFIMAFEEASKIGPIAKEIVYYVPRLMLNLAFIAAMALGLPTAGYFTLKMYFLWAVLLFTTFVFSKANIEAFDNNLILKACVILAPFIFGPAAMATMIVLAYVLVESGFDRSYKEVLDNVKITMRARYLLPGSVLREIAENVGSEE